MGNPWSSFSSIEFTSIIIIIIHTML
jgi:hypothetical protein